MSGPVILNVNLVPHPADTYFVRLGGYILIVDRAAESDDGDLVIAKRTGRMFLTRLTLRTGGERVDFEVWGKVIFILHGTT